MPEDIRCNRRDCKRANVDRLFVRITSRTGRCATMIGVRIKMPVIIGAKRKSNFSDPIGLPGDCHRQIEHFLSVLIQVAKQARRATHRGAKFVLRRGAALLP
jgi:hypothetical protein